MQGRNGRQDRQDRGLAWILQNRTRWRQRRQRQHGARDVAATAAVLPTVRISSEFEKELLLRNLKNWQSKTFYNKETKTSVWNFWKYFTVSSSHILLHTVVCILVRTASFRENALWYTTAFSSNSSSLRPVFLTNTELLSTSFTELMSTTEFS